MSIKSESETGFTTVTRKGDVVVEETNWDYATDFGLVPYSVAEAEAHIATLPKDSVVVIVNPGRLNFNKWQCRRASSENLTNASTSVAKGAPIAAVIEEVLKKRDSLKRGEIATGGGLTLDPFERELRTFAERWMIARGVPSKIAMDYAKTIDKAIEYVTKMVLENDTPEERTRIRDLWESKARARVDDYAATSM